MGGGIYDAIGNGSRCRHLVMELRTGAICNAYRRLYAVGLSNLMLFLCLNKR